MGSHASSDGQLPETAVSHAVGRLISAVGEAASWLWLALVLVIMFQVVMRYALGQGSILLEELQWHIYGVGFLLGLGYCAAADRHVRITVVSDRWSLRTRTIIEVVGILIFLLPLCIAVVVEGGKMAITAYQLRETSAAPGGLPMRWLMKSFIPLGFILLGLAAVAHLTRCAAYLSGRSAANR